MKKNVLIFPSGTEISFEILNALKYSKFVNIFGGTSVNDHSRFVFKNMIENFPYIDEPDFIVYLNKIVIKYNIDYIYPAHDSACVVLSKHKDKIKAKVIVTEYETVSVCRSKKATYQYFKNERFIPNVYDSLQDIKMFPVFVKPAIGEGSKGALKVETQAELKRLMTDDPTLVISEYLPGDEYTIDCFTDKNGSLLSVKMRNRERIRSGISVRSSIINLDTSVMDIANTLNKQLVFKGAWFFQVKKNMDGQFKLMEASPRIPGTMGLSRNCGINYPLLTLFVFWGYDVDVLDNKYNIEVDRAFYSAYNIDYIYENIYIDYDDTLIIDDKVNTMLLSFIYQAIEKNKKVFILSKHIGDIYEDMDLHKINKSLFTDIYVIDHKEEKTEFIHEFPAIFIDDSFAERKKVRHKLDIPVFDIDMIESLIDWRM